MLKAIVLVCALSTPRAECTAQTALQMWQSAETMSLFSCMMQSQAKVAGQFREGDVYVKVLCRVVKNVDRLG